jgi:hypothetical protein
MAASGRTWRVTAVEGCANILAIFERDDYRKILPSDEAERSEYVARLVRLRGHPATPAKPLRIILITRKDFVLSDQTGVFFETRLK